MRRSLAALALLLITIPIGLAVRLLPLNLPWFLYKYLGSALWAVALYWFLATLLPKLRPLSIAAIAITIATLVELSRLLPIAPIDAFRLTFAGKIFLGRYFSIKSIAAYLLAIALTAALRMQSSSATFPASSILSGPFPCSQSWWRAPPFFVRMDIPRLLLIFSAATFVMLAPFVVTFALHSDKLRYAFFYLSVSTLSFSLWALSRYEQKSPRLFDPMKR